MQTILAKASQLPYCSSLIQQGELVAFPTETVYGLGADATNDLACQKIYTVKRRPQDNPFIIHLANQNMLKEAAKEVPETAKELFKRFSPGPLTVVLPKTSLICSTATAGLSSVGIRIPASPLAQQFLSLCQRPIAGPSANRSGRPSPTNASMVYNELNGSIAAIIDGGSASIGLESTVVSCLQGKTVLLRAGSVSYEEIAEALNGEKVIYNQTETPNSPVLSPGQKYRHYQPDLPLLLTEELPWPQLLERFESQKIVLLTLTVPPDNLPERWQVYYFKTLADYAAQLYRIFTEAGNQNAQTIIAQTPQPGGLGLALKDRLQRAASGIIDWSANESYE